MIVALLMCAFAGGALAAGPYASEGFLEVPPEIELKSVSAVAVDGRGQIYVLHRDEPPLLVFDPGGKYLRGFGEGLFQTAHGLRIAPDGSVWTTDNGGHVLRKFSPEGRLLATYGKRGEPGSGPGHFRSPDDLVFASTGEIFVADAGNGRIVRLSLEGDYLGEWGRKGDGEGEFAAAHGLAIDDQDRIYVCDRGHDRIQVFSTEGELLAVWGGFGNPFGALVVGDQLLVSDGDAHRISHLDLKDGKLEAQWGDPEKLRLPHLMAIDRSGKLYVAEVAGARVQIFSPVEQRTNE